MIYMFRNKSHMDYTAKMAGLKKIIFTNGYDKKWEIDIQ